MEQDELDRLMEQATALQEGGDAADAEVTWDDAQREQGAARDMAPKTEINEVKFAEIKNINQGKVSMDMDFILDIPLTLTVELGRSRLLISEMLQLGQGSVVELTKLAGEPMEIFVNHQLIARGEVVVVNEKFGVRLTDIISPAERVNRLR